MSRRRGPKPPRLGESLSDVNPALSAEWHPTKNGDLTAFDVMPFCNTKVWWLQPDGHEFTSTVSNRTKGSGCAVCNGRQVQVGVNDLATLRPDLAAQWHPTKNGDVTPSQVTVGSASVKRWWFLHGHEWKAAVFTRTRGNGCAVCSGSQIQVGVNDLVTLRPDLAAEWHPTKNGDLTPYEVTVNSNRMVWWNKPDGHEWKATIFNRFQGDGCAVCHGKQVQIGVNDLATLRPDLAAQWHPTKNGDLTPRDVTVCARGGGKVWWLCRLNHEWDATLSSRSREASGCPDCAKAAGWATSLAEQALRRELTVLYSGVHEGAVRLPRGEGRTKTWNCDIGIDLPDGRLAVIEYDSQFFHLGNELGDAIKAEDLRSQGHLVVRIRLGRLLPLHEHDLHLSLAQGHHTKAADMAALVAERLGLLDYPPDTTSLTLTA